VHAGKLPQRSCMPRPSLEGYHNTWKTFEINIITKY
jgi:hypothetical protein